MSKKNETILIRLDAKTKDRFRLYCESKRLTMTDVLTDEINLLLLNSEENKSSSDLSLLKKERNFFKSELSIYEEVYNDIYRMFNSLKKNHIFGMEKLYSDLFVEKFESIEEFQGYELIENNINTNHGPDFIALNKLTNHKLLIDFKNALHLTSFSVHRNAHYLSWLNENQQNTSVGLIFITFQPFESKMLKEIENFSTRINYDVNVFHIDELLKL